MAITMTVWCVVDLYCPACMRDIARVSGREDDPDRRLDGTVGQIIIRHMREHGAAHNIVARSVQWLTWDELHGAALDGGDAARDGGG